LKKKIKNAVETFMRTEDYRPNRSLEIKRRARTLMKRRHVQVAVPEN